MTLFNTTHSSLRVFCVKRIQCQKSKDDAENFSICLCSDKFHFDSVEKKCKVVLDHFTVKKMYPKPNDGMVLIGGSAGFSGRLGVQ